MARPPLVPTDKTHRICLAIPSKTLAQIDKAAHEAGMNRSRFCRDIILKQAENVLVRIEKMDRILAALDKNG